MLPDVTNRLVLDGLVSNAQLRELLSCIQKKQRPLKDVGSDREQKGR